MACANSGHYRILVGTDSLPTEFRVLINKVRNALSIPDAEMDHVDDLFHIEFQFRERGILQNAADLKIALDLWKNSTEITFTFNGNSYIVVITNLTWSERPGTDEATFFEYNATANVIRRI